MQWRETTTSISLGPYSVGASAPEFMLFLVSLPNSKGTKKATVVSHVYISFCAEVQETSANAFTQ